MGHESQIELWSPNLTTFCFAGFGTDRLRRQEAMKTAGTENPNRCAITRQPTELLERKLEASLLNQSGWKARKHPAAAEYFFLTFPFIELPTTRCAARGTSASAAGAVGRGQETLGLETALRDPLDRSDPGGGAAGNSADPAPFRHQAAAVDLQRVWHRDKEQRRSPS